MSDSRSVSTDALATLGTIIDETAGRDAIHLAVEPSIAGDKLYPGQDVGFLPNGAMSGKVDNTVGIVDPFLPRSVMPGQRFWLIIYPRQITSLRHVWAHPAFEAAKELAAKGPEEEAARKRLEDYAATLPTDSGRYDDVDVGPVTLDQLLEHATAYQEGGEYWCEGGRFEGVGLYEGFWDDYATVTGKAVKQDNEWGFFSCSC